MYHENRRLPTHGMSLRNQRTSTNRPVSGWAERALCSEAAFAGVLRRRRRLVPERRAKHPPRAVPEGPGQPRSRGDDDEQVKVAVGEGDEGKHTRESQRGETEGQHEERARPPHDGAQPAFEATYRGIRPRREAGRR